LHYTLYIYIYEREFRRTGLRFVLFFNSEKPFDNRCWCIYNIFLRFRFVFIVSAKDSEKERNKECRSVVRNIYKTRPKSTYNNICMETVYTSAFSTSGNKYAFFPKKILLHLIKIERTDNKLLRINFFVREYCWPL